MRALAKALAPRRRHWRMMAAWLLCAAAGVAQAPSAATDHGSDPPSRAARLSYVAGDLGVLPAGAKDWIGATINRPMTTGDRLSTGQDSRAELQLGGSTMRLGAHTSFGFLALNDQLAQIELTQGTLNLAARQFDQGQSVEIDTPTLALVVDQPGTFRIDIGGDGQSTRVTVLDGSAIVYGENNARHDVAAGHSYDFGDPSFNNLVITDLGGGDAFDRWCSERDQGYAQSAATQYVSEDVVGYQDLDRYGDWQSEDDYGAVWFPNDVSAGWAPYSDGCWVFIAPWGWSWVDALPWGYAPFHYGRWAYIHHAWGWIPGPRLRRPVYAPALVAFIGGGGWGTSIGVGGRPVGWFPLGPGEIFNPWYRASGRYFANVNLANINPVRGNAGMLINSINSHYADFRNGRSVPNPNFVNRSAPHGLTVVSSQSFASASSVRRNLLQVDPHQLTAAPVLAGAGVHPDAASLGRPRSAKARPLPAGGFQRQVIARQAPASSLASASLPGFAPQSASNVRVLTAAAPTTTFHGPTAQQTPVHSALPNSGPSGARLNSGPLPAAPHVQPDNTQRPGVSFISSADEDRQRAEFPSTGLPQAPHVERVSPGQPQPAEEREQQRYESARNMHDNVPAPTYRMPTPQPYYEPTTRPMPPQQASQQAQPSPSAARGAPQPPARAQPGNQPSRGYSDDAKH